MHSWTEQQQWTGDVAHLLQTKILYLLYRHVQWFLLKKSPHTMKSLFKDLFLNLKEAPGSYTASLPLQDEPTVSPTLLLMRKHQMLKNDKIRRQLEFTLLKLDSRKSPEDMRSLSTTSPCGGRIRSSQLFNSLNLLRWASPCQTRKNRSDQLKLSQGRHEIFLHFKIICTIMTRKNNQEIKSK